MATLDGRELVAEFQAGDRDAAMAELYERYHPYVLGLIAKRTNPALAEDLAQDVWVKALRYLDGWTWQGKQLTAWLATIANGLIASHYRTSRVRLTDYVGDAVELDRRNASSAAAEAVVIERMRNSAVLDAMATLTDRQREAMRLRFVDERPVADAARVMGSSRQAVTHLTHHARRALAEQLGSYAEAVSRG